MSGCWTVGLHEDLLGGLGLFRNNLLPVYYKPARCHLLMALRYLIGGTDMPALTANKMTGYANKIADILWADDASVEAFKKAIEVIDEVLAGDVLTRDVVKTQSFTDSVKASAVARAEAKKVAAEAKTAKQ